MQKGDGVARRRGVEDDHVGGTARASALTLPSTRMSLMPGTADATTSSAPDDTYLLRDAGEAVVLEVLEQRAVGGQRAGPDVGRCLSGPPPAESTASS